MAYVYYYTRSGGRTSGLVASPAALWRNGDLASLISWSTRVGTGGPPLKALGHRRPLGTTARVRMDWNETAEPTLDDVTLESGSARWYAVVGIEEHRDSPAVWKLILERVSEEDALERLRAGARYWPHVRYR